MLKPKSSPVSTPQAEQPYKVPYNWRWVNIGDISTLYRGVSYEKKEARAVKGENDILILRGGNIGEGYIDTDADNVYVNRSLVDKDQMIQKHDVVIVGSTGSKKVIGRAGISDRNYQDVAFGAFLILVRPQEMVNPQYFDYYFLSDSYRNRIRELAKGININNVRVNYITQTAIPFPPLAEQQRIVDRIDGLFAKLDAAQEKAQAVLDGYEPRKAAILHRAFTGELTAEWRKTHNHTNDSWKTLKFCDVAEVKSNLVNPLEFPHYPHIAPDNIEKRSGILLSYHTIREDGVTSNKHRFYAGQILYSKIRPYLSKVIVADFDGLCSADMYPIEPKEGLDAFYLWYYMLSNEFLYQASTAGSRSLLPKINQKELSRISIRITDIEEQKEIVSMLNSHFDKERRIKNMAKQVIDRIEMMKKAILGRAFRGELGTNDPAEKCPEIANLRTN